MTDEGKAEEPAPELSEQGLLALKLSATGEPFDSIASKLDLWPWQVNPLLKKTAKALGALNVNEAIQIAKEQGLI